MFTQINKIEVSQHHNLLICGTEDTKLRFIDIKSNKQVKTLVGHADSVSCLAPMSASQPDLLITGGHDGAVRAWDLRNFQLLSDMYAHRSKYGEGTLALAN